MENTSIAGSEQSIAEENARFMSGVYKWMTIGIIITGVFSYFRAGSPEMINFILMVTQLFG